MAEPIVFISRHRIVEERRDDLARAYAGAVDLIRATKPATALFAAYLDQAGAEVRIVHAFRDAAAMALHFEGSGERSQAAAGLMTPAGFEIYGRAPGPAIDQLRREAAPTHAHVDVLDETLGGFLRAVD